MPVLNCWEWAANTTDYQLDDRWWTCELGRAELIQWSELARPSPLNICSALQTAFESAGPPGKSKLAEKLWQDLRMLFSLVDLGSWKCGSGSRKARPTNSTAQPPLNLEGSVWTAFLEPWIHILGSERLAGITANFGAVESWVEERQQGCYKGILRFFLSTVEDSGWGSVFLDSFFIVINLLRLFVLLSTQPGTGEMVLRARNLRRRVVSPCRRK
ncbi:uncharacterized protein PAC_10431 [Phialocephala subalpina]|uniref:Uncharacterized protein n=1 Tax=Phialocephala subalpina TaxID=576137 RepID=A0A1L7X684_9HELO|nr:uncharacterized protein PAC_10431 [Phialocephala subalpina]